MTETTRPRAIRIEQVAYADPVAQRLVEEVQQEYVVRYGGPDGARIDPTEFDPPTGAFFVAYVDQEPAATGAWRMLEDGEHLGGSRPAEIKRMYVRAAHRRTGLARAVLAHLETTAAAAGADVLVLESGIMQPEALALYASAGYVEVEPFGHYREYDSARHLGKRLGVGG